MEATTMGSLFDELARREAAVRQRIEEIQEQIAELNGLLEAEEDRLSRLVITRETVQEVLGESAGVIAEPVTGPGPADAGETTSPIGVLTVPPWRPGMTPSALPAAYQDAVEILADAAEPIRAGQIASAMGLEDTAAKREGLRSKLKRLVERGWATQDEPGLFTLTIPVARELAAGPSSGSGDGPDGIVSSPAG
ncbi:hypothetical protein [Actinomadura rubrisoli]|uniref:hypothetical protein n=1 Tax=Actinomadura rubrisoli TaxID=2530368 RepID=UPI001A9D97AD|nr:hypothetical protein [Actinomadura rubrisoli]